MIRRWSFGLLAVALAIVAGVVGALNFTHLKQAGIAFTTNGRGWILFALTIMLVIAGLFAVATKSVGPIGVFGLGGIAYGYILNKLLVVQFMPLLACLAFVVVEMILLDLTVPNKNPLAVRLKSLLARRARPSRGTRPSYLSEDTRR